MLHPMRRREFLTETGRTALSLCFLPLTARVKENQAYSEPRDGVAWRDRIDDAENQLPKLMQEAVVPGLSIAVIKDAKLSWHRGFGVKDSESRTPVDNDTMFEAASMSIRLCRDEAV